jgi:hypothetical protein
MHGGEKAAHEGECHALIVAVNENAAARADTFLQSCFIGDLLCGLIHRRVGEINLFPVLWRNRAQSGFAEASEATNRESRADNDAWQEDRTSGCTGDYRKAHAREPTPITIQSMSPSAVEHNRTSNHLSEAITRVVRSTSTRTTATATAGGRRLLVRVDQGFNGARTCGTRHMARRSPSASR